MREEINTLPTQAYLLCFGKREGRKFRRNLTIAGCGCELKQQIWPGLYAVHVYESAPEIWQICEVAPLGNWLVCGFGCLSNRKQCLVHCTLESGLLLYVGHGSFRKQFTRVKYIGILLEVSMCIFQQLIIEVMRSI